MQIHSAEEARKRFESLPQEIKELLYGPTMTFAIQQVGQKNHLHIDQIDFLNSETGQVLLGFVETKDFADEIREGLSIDQQKAETIAKDVDEMLFSKIRGAMQKNYEANKSPAMPVASIVIEPKPVEAAPTPISMAPKQPLSSVLPVSKPESASIMPPPPPITPPAPVVMPMTPPVAAVPTTPPMPMAPKPVAPAPGMVAADTMLSQKTVDIAPPKPATPPQPGNYKKDPYREPAE